MKGEKMDKIVNNEIVEIITNNIPIKKIFRFMNYWFIFVFSTAKNINFYQLNHQDYEICRITSSFMFRGRGIDERHAGE